MSFTPQQHQQQFLQHEQETDPAVHHGTSLNDSQAAQAQPLLQTADSAARESVKESPASAMFSQAYTASNSITADPVVPQYQPAVQQVQHQRKMIKKKPLNFQ